MGIGVIQALSFIPGVSRAGATILGGMVFGLSRSAAVEFSFLLAVPVMVAASLLDLVRSAGSFVGADWTALLVGFVSAFAVGLASMLLLVRFVKTHTLEPFAYYRIILAGLLFFVLF
jgi:undecaprenyl-diphosphatase